MGVYGLKWYMIFENKLLNICLIFHVQLLILFLCFEFFLSSAPEEVKRVFSLQNANQVKLTPDNSNPR